MSIGKVIPPFIFRYHGSFDNSFCEGNLIMWAGFMIWMYPIYGYMNILKGYVKNHY